MQGTTCIEPFPDNEPAKPKKSKNKFTEVEDEIIKKFVEEYGAHTWGRIMPLLPGRTSRQVRERYVNYLAPNVKHDDWTKEEDELIEKLVAQFGKRWAFISRSFKQRTDVSIKNRYLKLKRNELKNLKKNSSSTEKVMKFNSPVQNNLNFQPLQHQNANNQPSDTLLFNDVVEEQNFKIDDDFIFNDDQMNVFDFMFFA